MIAPDTSTPIVVRFSPNAPGPKFGAEHGRPPRRVLARVGIDPFVLAAMNPPVGLFITGKVDPSPRDPARDRRLADRADHRPSSPGDRDLPSAANVHAHERTHPPAVKHAWHAARGPPQPGNDGL